MNQQPEALRLADDLEFTNGLFVKKQAAAELRRLHEAYEWQRDMAHERLRRMGKLEVQRDELHAENEALRKDAERLNYLIEQRAYVVSDPDACPGYWLHFVNKQTGGVWVQADEHATPRMAIDAAMKGQS